jgi:hypothetical protein
VRVVNLDTGEEYGDAAGFVHVLVVLERTSGPPVRAAEVQAALYERIADPLSVRDSTLECETVLLEVNDADWV